MDDQKHTHEQKNHEGLENPFSDPQQEKQNPWQSAVSHPEQDGEPSDHPDRVEQPLPPSTQSSPAFTSQKDGTRTFSLLKWTFIFAGILLGVFYFVLLWALLSGNIDNPLFQSLGIDSRVLKGSLLNLTDALFALGSLTFLILTLVKFFQWIIIEKNAENRRDYIVRAGIFGIFLVVTGGLWVLFRTLINNVKVDSFGQENHMILTQPANTIGLTAPIVVEFDLETKLYQKIKKELVRQISWDFEGDGVIDATGDRVMNRFLDKGDNNGRFPVTVRVEYIIPQTKEEKMQEWVREVIISNESVRANVTADQESGPVPLDVQFSANGSKDPDGEIVLYEWDLDGDGEYEVSGDDQTVIEKRFEKVGNYTVGLRVTGRRKDTDEATIDIVVGDSDKNLISKIQSDNGFEGMMPFEVTLDGGMSFSRVGDIIKYEWFIEGESEPSPGKTIKRTFRRPGEYEVFLTVQNDRGEKSRVTKTITVLDNQVGAEVKIKSTPEAEKDGIIRGKIPFEVEFDTRSSTVKNPIEWRWDFQNDGVIDDYSDVASYIYRETGEYTVTLTIIDSLEREFTETRTVLVEGVGTKALIKAHPSSGIAPLKVNFDGSGSRSDSGDIVSYIWYLPDEEPFNYDANLDYEFDSVGTYPVKLKILTSDGKTDETTSYIVVRAQPLKAYFDYQLDPEMREVVFNPEESKGTIVSYNWDFGDGETSRRVAPVHTYPFAGTFTAVLEVRSPKGIVSTYTQEIVIE